jgi:hypothetical protein
MNPSAGILGTGMKLTLMTISGDTGIEAYNFNLRAGQTAGGDPEIILSDSGAPYLAINASVNNATKPLVYISEQDQYLQSSNYVDGSSGIRLDLSG